MRCFAIVITAGIIYSGIHGAALAQTSTPNVTASFSGLSTPLTSTTTNCMMSCNARAANCQTSCVVPSPPTTTSAGTTTTLNATANTACMIGCTSNQLAHLMHGKHELKANFCETRSSVSARIFGRLIGCENAVDALGVNGSGLGGASSPRELMVRTVAA